jgi:antitoxin MazE
MNESEQLQVVLDKWERRAYLSQVRRTAWGTPTIEVPEAILQTMEVEPGSAVAWEHLEDGTLRVSIAPPPKYSLDDLVAGITEENRHALIDTGSPVGKEVW